MDLETEYSLQSMVWAGYETVHSKLCNTRPNCSKRRKTDGLMGEWKTEPQELADVFIPLKVQPLPGRILGLIWDQSRSASVESLPLDWHLPFPSEEMEGGSWAEPFLKLSINWRPSVVMLKAGHFLCPWLVFSLLPSPVPHQAILKEVDSLLYVDTDVVFLRPVDDIWRLLRQFNSSQLAAMAPEHEIPRMGWYSRFAQHPFYGPAGVNSGVMLMNLTRIRSAQFKVRKYFIFPCLKFGILSFSGESVCWFGNQQVSMEGARERCLENLGIFVCSGKAQGLLNLKLQRNFPSGRWRCISEPCHIWTRSVSSPSKALGDCPWDRRRVYSPTHRYKAVHGLIVYPSK